MSATSALMKRFFVLLLKCHVLLGPHSKSDHFEIKENTERLWRQESVSWPFSILLDLVIAKLVADFLSLTQWSKVLAVDHAERRTWCCWALSCVCERGMTLAWWCWCWSHMWQVCLIIGWKILSLKLLCPPVPLTSFCVFLPLCLSLFPVLCFKAEACVTHSTWHMKPLSCLEPLVRERKREKEWRRGECGCGGWMGGMRTTSFSLPLYFALLAWSGKV